MKAKLPGQSPAIEKMDSCSLHTLYSLGPVSIKLLDRKEEALPFTYSSQSIPVFARFISCRSLLQGHKYIFFKWYRVLNYAPAILVRFLFCNRGEYTHYRSCKTKENLREENKHLSFHHSEVKFTLTLTCCRTVPVLGKELISNSTNNESQFWYML